MIGQRLDGFALQQVLYAQEDGSAVYYAEHPDYPKGVAIKVIRNARKADLQMYRREVGHMQRLRHEHIVTLLKADALTDFCYIAMTYAAGGSLRTRYPEGTIADPQRVVEITEQLAPALDYAHQQGIIHRDIKPSNCLLTADGQVLLSDFGIAVEAGAKQDFAGTLAYMAPEQISGQAVFASDQYALAVLAYELLCGHVPFDGKAIAHRHMHEVPPPASGLHPSLVSVLTKGLAKAPQDRYESAGDFALALKLAYMDSTNRTYVSSRSFDTLTATSTWSTTFPGASMLQTFASHAETEVPSAKPVPSEQPQDNREYGYWDALVAAIVIAPVCWYTAVAIQPVWGFGLGLSIYLGIGSAGLFYGGCGFWYLPEKDKLAEWLVRAVLLGVSVVGGAIIIGVGALWAAYGWGAAVGILIFIVVFLAIVGSQPSR